MFVSFTATGEFEFARSRGVVSIAIPVGLTEIFIPPKVYIKLSRNDGVPFPRGKSWVAVDVGTPGGPGVAGLVPLPSGGSTDPADLLAR
jgi:hypothetical protein